MVLFLFLFSNFLNDSISFPDWFYKTPNNSIVVIVPDQYSQSARAYALYKEANLILALRENLVETKGYSATERTKSSKQTDKYEVDWLIHSKSQNYLDIFNYKIIDYKRYPYKMIIALFSDKDFEFKNEKRQASRPKWVDGAYGIDSSIGFGAGNFNFSKNWSDAFEHAIFNFSVAKKNKNVSENIYLKNNLNDKFLDRSYSVSMNFSDYIFNGILITDRWYDKQDGTCYVRIRKRY